MMDRVRGMIEVVGCNHTWRKLGVKTEAEFKKRWKGTMTKNTKLRRKQKRRHRFRGNRLYLGKPPCGGLE